MGNCVVPTWVHVPFGYRWFGPYKHTVHHGCLGPDIIQSVVFIQRFHLLKVCISRYQALGCDVSLSVRLRSLLGRVAEAKIIGGDQGSELGFAASAGLELHVVVVGELLVLSWWWLLLLME